jgi:alkylhydroperoxidase family enzyme
VDINSATLLKRGVPLEKVEALQAWRESSFFDEKERVALGYAEAMTFSHTKVDEEMIGELRRYFDDEAMVELTGLIGFQNMSSKFNSALSVPPQGFCQIPKSKLLDETVPETPHADSAAQ